jgi:ribosomal protein S18 acetylase RimI-like enzyme
VVHYRIFRNNDPPLLVKLWNQIYTSRSAAVLSSTSLLEMLVLAKPYFDPAGLFLAEEDGQAVGFAHAGFGPSPDETTISKTAGVICVLGVLPTFRRRGIGSQLLHQCENYLRGSGAQWLYAGTVRPLAPFYLGLYGGSEAPGLLKSDTCAEPFLLHNHYQPCDTSMVFQRRLDGNVATNDGRFGNLRRRFEMRVAARSGRVSWWQECVLGPLELVEFRLEDKLTRKTVALASLWDMETFAQRWQMPTVGIMHIEVQEEMRRQGLAKFLLAQIFKHLQDQYFALAEMQVAAHNTILADLCKSAGFEQIDVGHVYRREEPAAEQATPESQPVANG